MRTPSSACAAISLSLLASVASSQLTTTLPQCWQTCMEQYGPQCGSTKSDCFCQVASTDSFDTILACARKTCSTDSPPGLIIDNVGALQQACRDTQSPMPYIAAENPLKVARDSIPSQTSRIPSVQVAASKTANQKMATTGTSRTTALHMVTSSEPPALQSTLSEQIVADTAIPTFTQDLLTPTPTSSSKSTSTSDESQGGTLLDMQSAGTKERAGSLLSLMIGVMAGIAWF